MDYKSWRLRLNIKRTNIETAVLSELIFSSWHQEASLIKITSTFLFYFYAFRCIQTTAYLTLVICFVVGCVKEAHSESNFISIKAGWGSTVDAWPHKTAGQVVSLVMLTSCYMPPLIAHRRRLCWWVCHHGLSLLPPARPPITTLTPNLHTHPVSLCYPSLPLFGQKWQP